MGSPAGKQFSWSWSIEGWFIRAGISVPGAWAMGVVGVGASYWNRWLVAMVALWGLEITVARGMQWGLNDWENRP